MYLNHIHYHSLYHNQLNVDNQVCEGLGERIMGLVFDYSGGFRIKCMSLN